MTAPWGPGLDAEVAYRQEQVRAQFGHRRHHWFRRIEQAVRTSGAPTSTGPVPATIPRRRGVADARTGAPVTAASTAGREGSATTRLAA